MATIKYLLQSNSNYVPIYLRLSLEKNKSIKRKTGLYIDHKDWSKSTGFPKQNNPQNKNLTTVLRKLSLIVMEKLNEANKDGLKVSGDWLIYNIDLHFKRIEMEDDSNLLSDSIQDVIDNAGTKVLSGGRVGLSKNRIKGYVTFKGVIDKFEKDKNKIVDLQDIDITFENKFRNWLIKEQGFSTNYAGKNIDNLKAVCNEATKMGKNVNPHVKNIKTFKESKENIEVITLNFDELEQIENLNNLSESLENVRKWLLFGCEIGQRGGDLLKVSKDNFRSNEDGVELIDVWQEKTGKTISIGVSSKIKRILGDVLPYGISIQKFNDYLKELCKLAEINTPTRGRLHDNEKNRKVLKMCPKYKLISSHICRRSFSTNYYKKIKTPVLMEVTGHSKESLFLTYIGKPKDKDDNAIILLEGVERIEGERSNKRKNKINQSFDMKVVKRAK